MRNSIKAFFDRLRGRLVRHDSFRVDGQKIQTYPSFHPSQEEEMDELYDRLIRNLKGLGQ